jgi:hypothetical protein
MPKAKNPTLTVKQAKFVKAVATGMPKYKAAMAAYDTTDMQTASRIANENLQKTPIQEALQSELSRQGLTIEKIVKPLIKGIEAKKTVQIEGDFFTTEVDDLDAQYKAHDRILKIMGVKDGGDGVTINIEKLITEQRNQYDI